MIWLVSLLGSWLGLTVLGNVGLLSGDWGMVLAVATLAALWVTQRRRLTRMEKKLDRLLAAQKEDAETEENEPSPSRRGENRPK
ncbi:hypothetical protein [Oscillibacter sp.]|uniref:hypothetical protein n=1 Tax=Oscillibacter sp. TaxID=1945593 RepID=UPI0026212020|nr:hypothetical protein [Oscillibacter sp.]